MIYNDYIIEILRDKQISLLGFADLKEINIEQRQGLRYGICIAIALEVFPSVGTPTLVYYNEYKNINTKLRKISLFLEEKIIEKGYNAYSLFKNRQNEDFRTVLPFKTLATCSGIVWIGKSSMLITKEYGNAVRLGGVITDMPFETSTPYYNTSYCGNCTECVEKCPAKAITGNNWELNSDRNDLINPFSCKNMVIDRGKEMGVTVGSCGICISVCPWTKKYIKQRGANNEYKN